jgi:hypothetical protein
LALRQKLSKLLQEGRKKREKEINKEGTGQNEAGRIYSCPYQQCSRPL